MYRHYDMPVSAEKRIRWAGIQGKDKVRGKD